MLIRYSYFIAGVVLALLLILPYLGISLNKNKAAARYNNESSTAPKELLRKDPFGLLESGKGKNNLASENAATINLKEKTPTVIPGSPAKLSEIEDLLNGKN